jgi:nucleoside-diphosphate-sugar epimerase
MKKNLSKLGKPRLLIIGCGDVGQRLIPLLRERFRIIAVTSQTANHAALRAAGALPVCANLDHPASLARLSGLAHYIVHLAPPHNPTQIDSREFGDQRTRNLLAILPDNSRLVYISTSGVYGDCAGAVFDETRRVQPANPRAKRRVAAENLVRAWARRSHSCASILRVPGIYAAHRLPLERLQKGTPALCAADDVYTNHIHAGDLALLIKLALFRALPNRVYHAVDDSEMKMADYFDLVADTFALPRPARLTRAELAQQVSPLQMSFMSESRRLQNQRIKAELGARLRYVTVQHGVRAALLQSTAI